MTDWQTIVWQTVHWVLWNLVNAAIPQCRGGQQHEVCRMSAVLHRLVEVPTDLAETEGTAETSSAISCSLRAAARRSDSSIFAASAAAQRISARCISLRACSTASSAALACSASSSSLTARTIEVLQCSVCDSCPCQELGFQPRVLSCTVPFTLVQAQPDHMQQFQGSYFRPGAPMHMSCDRTRPGCMSHQLLLQQHADQNPEHLQEPWTVRLVRSAAPAAQSQAAQRHLQQPSQHCPLPALLLYTCPRLHRSPTLDSQRLSAYCQPPAAGHATPQQ